MTKRAGLFVILLALLAAGCSTPSIDKARMNFYSARYAQADENLKELPAGDKDEILFLSERGMVRQVLGKYDESSTDWRQAMEISGRTPATSVSKSTASLLVNDRMLTYRGMPFERTLIYTFLAKNYLAQSNWNYAAICARNIIAHLENLDGFPDIPYSRYLAGFCLELIDDRGNAAIQYRAAGKILNNLAINPDTGEIKIVASNITSQVGGGPAAPRTGTSTISTVAAERDGHLGTLQKTYELVCFVGIGKMPKWCRSDYEFDMAPYAELYCADQYLGQSYPIANAADLMISSKNRLAAIQAVKDTSRIVLKEVISESIESQNEALGGITRLILFSLEQPDTRCWETLPLWLEVARVPCPANLKSYKVVFKTSNGVALKSKTIEAPITRRGNIYISFCRDLEEQEPAQTASP